MKSIAKIGLCVAAISIWFGCKKENNFSDTPVIEHREIYKTSDTSAVWLVGFTDGDGDIGLGDGEQPDETNFKTTILIVDSGRVDTTITGSGYRVPRIEGVETRDGIEGEIRIELQLDLFELEPFPVDTIYYQGYLVDRSGKSSNVIETPIVVVN